MQLCIKDLDKREVIKSIYYTLLEKLPYASEEQKKLDSEFFSIFDDYVYIKSINNVLLDIFFEDDYIVFSDVYSNIYIEAIFNLMVEKCIILDNNLNHNLFVLLKDYKDRLRELLLKINDLGRQIYNLGFTTPNEIYRSKNVFKNTEFDNRLCFANNLWKERTGFINEYKDKSRDIKNIMLDMINLKGELVLKR